MRVVVTGASGHIGANLVQAMLERGWHVRALVRAHRHPIDKLDVETVEGDIRSPESLYHAFRGTDVVYHLAGYISLSANEWPLLHSVNVIGTRNVVEACISCGAQRLVHFSSIHALRQSSPDIPVDESTPLAASPDCAPYDRSKALGELEARSGLERGLDTVVISPTGVVGPYDHHPSHFGQVLLSLVYRRLPALVSGGFDWVDVRDVVQGAMEAQQLAPTGAKYILSGRWTSLSELAGMVAQITGVPSPRLMCPMGLARIGAPFYAALARMSGRRTLYTTMSLKTLRWRPGISHQRASQDLGYQPRPLENTLADTLRWWKEAGYLPNSISIQDLKPI